MQYYYSSYFRLVGLVVMIW